MPSKKKLLLTSTLSLSVALIVYLTYLWFILLSPFNYEYPEHMAAPTSEDGYQRVFVYGTLRYAPVRWIVMGRAGDPERQILRGYTKTALDIRPVVESADNERAEKVEGLLLKVTDEELRRLDRYERLGLRYLRKRVTLQDGREAWVYQLVE